MRGRPPARRPSAADAARAWPRRRHQVADIAPPPAPKITEYVAQAKQWVACSGRFLGQGRARFRLVGNVRGGGRQYPKLKTLVGWHRQHHEPPARSASLRRLGITGRKPATS